MAHDSLRGILEGTPTNDSVSDWKISPKYASFLALKASKSHYERPADKMSRKARVTFDYKANENDELDLVVDQIIEDITDEDEGWCKGFLDGKTGLFPNNFVEFISGESPARSKPASKDSLAGKKAKVTFDYEASNDDELSLKCGDVVEVICEVEDGWWEGKLRNGKTGVFPSNFVDLIKEDEMLPLKEDARESSSSGATEEEEGNKRSSIFGQQKMMGGGMGFGNIINAGILSGTKLKKVETKPKKEPEPEAKPQPDLTNSFASPLKKVSGGSSLKRKAPPAPPPVSAPAAAKKVEKAKVLYTYEKQNDDELNLVVGDIVTVINKEVYDTEGWWEGELNGKLGLFPDNFVELLPVEEETKMPPEQPPKQKTAPPPLTSPGPEKRAPPPLPDQENRVTAEAVKKEMKKAVDHEAPKLPAPKQSPKPNIDFSKPGLPMKKPVPPKPSTKPMLPSKKPVPKLPPDIRKDIPSKAAVKEQENSLKSNLRDKSDEDAKTSGEYNLDVVTPHETLKQLTTNRAGKQQLKRPPSTTRQSEGSLMDSLENMEIEEEEKKKPTDVEPKEPAWKREATKAREAREAKKLIEEKAPTPASIVREKKMPPPVFEKPEDVVEKRRSWIKDDIPTRKTEGASSDEVSSLRHEVTELRSLLSTMEKKMAAMERKHEERIKSLEKRLEKDIEQLTSDFDEERTNHARLKIEVDRLKKKMRRGSDLVDVDDSSHA